MGKRIILILLICLALSFTAIALCGGRHTVKYDLTPSELSAALDGTAVYQVTAEDPGIVEISNVRVQGTRLFYDLHALNRGQTFLIVSQEPGRRIMMQKVYVHRFGIITESSFFGRCTLGVLVPISILIALVLLYLNHIALLRRSTKENLYQYRNILEFGVVTFLTFLILQQIFLILRFRGIDNSVKSIISSLEAFAVIAFPVAFVMSILISFSNLNLMRKEGVSWRNMLGFLLGLAVCCLTVLPEFLYTFLLRHQIVDIFNEKGVATHLYAFFEHSLFFAISYLECILLGTVVFSIHAARHIPAFDKDYMLILGSRIRPDGTLTPLLQARADKAMEFAKKQEAAAGKKLVLVPSGGKGSDETIAEADAIGDYLRARGVPEERILTENRSASTYENIRNSMELIHLDFERRNSAAADGEEDRSQGEPAVAFSTTNYHVFRSGLLASEQGFRMEGIGSQTRRYFWVNAFIREFIATLAAEKRRHAFIVLSLLLAILVLTAMNYLSIIL
ncbi:MAG: YdcF family protein [Oscillospiraceae bacterium]|nr:YdcF family protein [Oscillospiraceae bacterium]